MGFSYRRYKFLLLIIQNIQVWNTRDRCIVKNTSNDYTNKITKSMLKPSISILRYEIKYSLSEEIRKFNYHKIKKRQKSLEKIMEEVIYITRCAAKTCRKLVIFAKINEFWISIR